MKQTKMKQFLSLILCIVLIAAAALFTFGCDDKAENPTDGEEKAFTFVVVDAEGKETSFSITSTKTYLGDALLDEGLIEGENDQYGLYVKKVNGILADYSVNGAYWRLVVNGTDSMVGASSVEIEDGATYQFVYSK